MTNLELSLIVIILLLISSLIYIIFRLINIYNQQCNTVQYRVSNPTFKEEQINPVKVSDIFKSMFNDATPGGSGYPLYDKPKVIETV